MLTAALEREGARRLHGEGGAVVEHRHRLAVHDRNVKLDDLGVAVGVDDGEVELGRVGRGGADVEGAVVGRVGAGDEAGHRLGEGRVHERDGDLDEARDALGLVGRHVAPVVTVAAVPATAAGTSVEA